MEEDIKILKELIEIGLEDFSDITITDRQAQAVENLIARLNYQSKSLLKYQNAIPKSKVQEKIEELEAMSISKDIYYDDIKRLFQELLED